MSFSSLFSSPKLSLPHTLSSTLRFFSKSSNRRPSNLALVPAASEIQTPKRRMDSTTSHRFFSTLPPSKRFLPKEGPTLSDFVQGTQAAKRVVISETLPQASLTFLTHVIQDHNPRYVQGGEHGEGVVVGEKELVKLKDLGLYTPEQLGRLTGDVGAQVQNRMRIKISNSLDRHFREVPQHAKGPNPAWALVAPSENEIADLNGSADPSNQNRYSPNPFSIHKYPEIVLIYSSINCSAHCRYCYRLDIFSGISGKEKANIQEMARYIKGFNARVAERTRTHGVMSETDGLMHDKITHEPLIPVSEVLLSGGDSLKLPNATLLRYMMELAESGVQTIRFGTKEFSFNPDRFDTHFFVTLDGFNNLYPNVKLEIIGHYSHPFELLKAKTDANGQYHYNGADYLNQDAIREDLKRPTSEINKRKQYLGHWNQFPIISGLNDRPEIIRLIIQASMFLGITMHNGYVGRPIIGQAQFQNLSVGEQWKMLENAKIGLSGIGNHFRLTMSTEWGKSTIVGADDNGLVYLVINRYVEGKGPENPLIIVDTKKLDCPFYWLDKEVIEKAVIYGKNVLLDDIDKRGKTSLVSQFKREAAAEAKYEAPPLNEPVIQNIQIRVKNEHGLLIDEFSIRPDEYKSLSQALEKQGHVIAVCGHNATCTTCVAKIEPSQPLKHKLKIDDDEEDILNTRGLTSEDQYRATCQIKDLRHYTVGDVDQTTITVTLVPLTHS